MKALYLSLVAAMLLTMPALRAGPIIPTSSCAPDFSSCDVYENQLTVFPSGGFGIAGDVIVQRGIDTIGVFRIFNDFFDSGLGTGLGLDAFLYSDFFANLPDTATYSINAVFIPVGLDQGNGFSETVYNGNGTDYNLFLANPEPSTFGLLGIGAALLVWRRRSAAATTR